MLIGNTVKNTAKTLCSYFTVRSPDSGSRYNINARVHNIMHCMRTRYSVASNSADCAEIKNPVRKMVGSLAERRAKTPTRTISLFLRASAKGALSRESFLEEILPRGPGSGGTAGLFIYLLFTSS